MYGLLADLPHTSTRFRGTPRSFSARLIAVIALGAASAQAETTVEFIASSVAHEGAAQSYRSIWQQDGARIVAALEARSCMPFAEASVTALIDDAVSHSGGPDHPMGLRATYDLDAKRATLVHELGHRHLWQLSERLDDVDGHQTLYLILDRIWAEVWGEEFAAARVHAESTWSASYDYAAAWAWAQALSVDQRGILWNRLLAQNGMNYCYAVYTSAGTASNSR